MQLIWTKTERTIKLKKKKKETPGPLKNHQSMVRHAQISTISVRATFLTTVGLRECNTKHEHKQEKKKKVAKAKKGFKRRCNASRCELMETSNIINAPTVVTISPSKGRRTIRGKQTSKSIIHVDKRSWPVFDLTVRMFDLFPSLESLENPLVPIWRLFSLIYFLFKIVFFIIF